MSLHFKTQAAPNRDALNDTVVRLEHDHVTRCCHQG